MKKIFYIFLFTFFSSSVYSQSGWVQQSPLPTGEPLRTIKFVNNTTGFIGTLYGSILKTTNGGILWTLKHFNNFEFSSIDFFDENTGIAVGSIDSILKTTDCGENWYIYPLSVDSVNPFFINCVGNSTAYTVGGSYPNNWTMLKTTNKGDNWSLLNYGYNHPLISIFFVNDNIGFATANDFAIKTTNGGQSWNQLQFSGGANSIYFVDQNTGFIAGYSSIQKTTNGGNNWVEQNPFGDLLYENIKFYDSNKGYVVGRETIISTSNGGENWIYQNYNLVEWLYGLSVINRDTAYLTGDHGVISLTTNGGLNWTSQFSGSTYNLNSIYFPSLDTGYAIGPGGLGYGVREMIKTTNGGNNWLYQTLPTHDASQKVYFLDDNTGFIVGGSVWKTTDGGFSWSNSYQQNFGYNDINFINNLTGYITGDDNTLKTTNGGINWLLLHDTTGFVRRYAIKFIDQNIGYEVGETGFIMKTINGGNNWFAQSSGTDQDLLTEFFINEYTGYIGSNDGLIIKTTNGGTNWIPVYNNLYCGITSIFFVNSSTGFAVSYPCSNSPDFIIKTTNSGNNWFLSDTTFARVGLNSIFFVNDSVGYTCGQAGIILKTTNGGNPIGIKKISNNIPRNYKLYQNYPNPFNPKTIINYQLPITSEVKIVIYDLLGRIVTTLINEKQNPGIYKIEWDGSKFASGVYFYQLRTHDFTQAKKLVLLK